MSGPGAHKPNALEGTRLLDSLGFRLALSIGATIVLGFAVFAFYSLAGTEDFCRSCTSINAERTSDIIIRSTRWAMLHNRKEDVAKIIESVGQQRDVLGVRIFDKRGRVVFSSDKKEIGHTVDTEAEACVSCHLNRDTVVMANSDERLRIFSRDSGLRVLGMSTPIPNVEACSSAACHAHPQAKTTLGILDIKMSLARADARRHQVQRHTILAALILSILAALVTVWLVSRLVRRPVGLLIARTRDIARGRLRVEPELHIPGELGQLWRSFDSMTLKLQRFEQQLTEARQSVEQKLDAKTQELSRSQRQIVHMEKMASLGKLSATVAHEINNPLAGILNYARLVERYLQEIEGWPDRDEAERCAHMIIDEAARCGDIVRNLLVFARRAGSAMGEAALHSAVERALMLVQHQIHISDVRLHKDLRARDDRLYCDVGQIEQALVAILINAVQAMEPGGQLVVRSEDDAKVLRVSIRDDGPGIPEEVLPHIFEPFFSTKDEGQGVGLGLAVVYGIVQRHGGELRVDSREGEGVCFTLILPRRVAADPPPAPLDVAEAAPRHEDHA